MAANPYDLTTRELLSILFRERLKLVLVFVGLCALVIGYSYLLTPYYEATTRLLVKTGREFQTRSDPNQPVVAVPSSTKQEIVNSEIQILTSRDLAQAVIDRIGADKLYPGATAETAVRNFQSDLKVTPVEQADVIDVSYKNRDHDTAVAALNAVVELYQQKHAEMFADPRYKFLDVPTKQYQDQLDAAVKKEAEIRSAKSLFYV
ncbi:MAG TPA: Wzz/FepE/Etk N-terminal domain-containing protein, partial [Stellaceae bacterium]|nr:Wzz/FepE/Etk N-terminal domain-containing protein [Stellaceae bacterium]